MDNYYRLAGGHGGGGGDGDDDINNLVNGFFGTGGNGGQIDINDLFFPNNNGGLVDAVPGANVLLGDGGAGDDQLDLNPPNDNGGLLDAAVPGARQLGAIPEAEEVGGGGGNDYRYVPPGGFGGDGVVPGANGQLDAIPEANYGIPPGGVDVFVPGAHGGGNIVPGNYDGQLYPGNVLGHHFPGHFDETRGRIFPSNEVVNEEVVQLYGGQQSFGGGYGRGQFLPMLNAQMAPDQAAQFGSFNWSPMLAELNASMAEDQGSSTPLPAAAPRRRRRHQRSRRRAAAAALTCAAQAQQGHAIEGGDDGVGDKRSMTCEACGVPSGSKRTKSSSDTAAVITSEMEQIWSMAEEVGITRSTNLRLWLTLYVIASDSTQLTLFLTTPPDEVRVSFVEELANIRKIPRYD